jgi:hypothetical protein
MIQYISMYLYHADTFKVGAQFTACSVMYTTSVKIFIDKKVESKNL